MWTCLKCNKKFEKYNQQHFCKVETVDEYIEQFDLTIQFQLKQVRECIKKSIPSSIEKISWGMPTYWNNVNIIHFAGNKNHIGLYPGSKAVIHFSKKLDEYGYKYSKGAIQIPYSNNLPLQLIKEICIWCEKERG